jgi:hypothetical protein
MSFDKTFFDGIGGLYGKIKKESGADEIQVMVRVGSKSYPVWGITLITPNVVGISYKDKQKPTETKKGEAWPVLVVPYENIESVEFAPIAPGDKQSIGFKQEPAQKPPKLPKPIAGGRKKY